MPRPWRLAYLVVMVGNARGLQTFAAGSQVIYRYHARVTTSAGRSFDLWLSARTQQALESAMAEVIGYMTEAN